MDYFIKIDLNHVRDYLNIFKVQLTFCFLLVSFLTYGQRKIPKDNSFIFNLSISSNFSHAYLNPELSFRFTPILFKTRETLFLGSGISLDEDMNISFIEKFQIGILNYKVSFVRGGNDEYITLFTGIQYKLSKDMSQHFLAPEIGYNFYTSPYFRLYISTLYQLPKSGYKWYNNIFIQTGFRYFLSNKSKDKRYYQIKDPLF